jgi:hypothetical protein
MQNGIERSKVAELERQAARGAPHLHGDLFDNGISLVQPAKGELAVEVQGDEALLPTPRYAGRSGHGVNLPGSPGIRSLKSFPGIFSYGFEARGDRRNLDRSILARLKAGRSPWSESL